MAHENTPGYGFYWRIWGILLLVTLVMLFVDRPTAQALGSTSGGLPRGLLIFILVVAMLLKAWLIAAFFMHLRFERLALGMAVLLGLLVNGFILFALIVPDGLRILGMGGT